MYVVGVKGLLCHTQRMAAHGKTDPLFYSPEFTGFIEENYTKMTNLKMCLGWVRLQLDKAP